MRTAVIFLLILCWHLAGGYSTATASDFHYQRSYAMARGMENLRQVSTAEANPFFLAAACDSLTEDITNLISDEDDEEEDVARKHIPPARYILALPRAFLTDHHYSYPTERLSLDKHPSCIDTPKYIIQSVLRI